MDDVDSKIYRFFKSPAFAVIGASTNREKYGNKVLRAYLQNAKKIYPVNPNEKTIENLEVISDIMNLPPEVNSISIVTPPEITQAIVSQAIKKGIKNIWMQPGAENDKAINDAEIRGINVIAKGPCVLVVLGFHEE